MSESETKVNRNEENQPKIDKTPLLDRNKCTEKIETNELKDSNNDNVNKDKAEISTTPVEKNDESSNSQEDDVKNNTNYDPKNVHYEGETAIYTDPESNYQYQWDNEKNEWVPHTKTTYGFEDDTHTYTDNDGIKYFWDKEKSAWFPKINDDFMAQYQMNYGFIDNTNIEVKKPPPKKELPKDPLNKGVKRKPSEPTWFEMEDAKNTKVYINNLPLDMKEEEFVELMQKCGIIMRDTNSGKMKIKMYTEPGTDNFKGDALCTYIRIESVDLALKLLDGYEVRGKKISVERAKFQMKGTYDPKLKPKSKKRKDKEKLKKMQSKLFDWRPEKQGNERAKHERIVIVRNAFESKMFDEDVGLILELQEDLREESSKCGEVRKVTIFDRHPEGVAQINMREPEEADAVVLLLNGRWFGKRKLTAEIWDGKTKFKIAETDSQITQRLDNWDKFLEAEEKTDVK